MPQPRFITSQAATEESRPPERRATARPSVVRGRPPGPFTTRPKRRTRPRCTSTPMVRSASSERSTRAPVAAWTWAPTSRLISGEVKGKVLSALRASMRKLFSSFRPASRAIRRASSLMASMSQATSRAGLRDTMPKTSRSLSSARSTSSVWT